MARKTYNDKLISKDLPKIVDLSDKPGFVEHYHTTTMLIASPMMYQEIMAKVPYGKLITTDRIREYLAAQNNAGITCALTAGIFINTVAHASEERQGENPISWWRTLKSKGELNEKYPLSYNMQINLLESEGHKIIRKGKKYFVENYEALLWNIEL
jgi:alkylated DNA nucleotide flippase Atl1